MLLLASHEDNKYNDCLTSMHTSKGAGVKDRIKDVKHSATNDPATKLKALYEELETALRELIECEIATIESLKKVQLQN